MSDIGRELRSVSGQVGREMSLEQMEDPHGGSVGRRLYVIQLRGRGNLSPFGGLYVGQTKQGRHARFAEHQAGGARAAQGLAGKCVRLRPELYADLDLMPNDEAIAMREEYKLARRLADAGFAVQTNGCHYTSSPPHARKLFTEVDLRRVSLQLRRKIVTDLLQSNLGDVDVDHLVHALRWCRDKDYGAPHPGLMGESIGRLAHVEKAAVEDLVEQVLATYRR